MTLTQSTLATKWATATDVLDRLAKVKTARETQRQILGDVDRRLRQRQNELESTLGDLPIAQRASVIDRAGGSLRRDLREATRSDRAQLLQSAVENAEIANGVSSHYTSATQMLIRESLGSERRGRILQQIQHSGPAELSALAEYAAGTKDAELAAALCSRNSTIKQAQRSFSSQELADAIFGDKHRAVRDALTELEVISREIVHEDRTFMTGKRDSVAGMSIELTRRGGMRVEDGDSSRGTFGRPLADGS